MDHFRHPRNLGEIKSADGQATVGNPVCGDVLQLFIKVGEKNGQEFIKDIKFQTLGCAAAIATSSIISTLVKGRPLAEAEKISNKVIIDSLGGLPKEKIHCSMLAVQALKKAIENYRQKK